MSPEAFAGWVLGFLDGTGGELTAAQVEILRERATLVATGVAPAPRVAPAPETKTATERVAEIREQAKTTPKKAPRRPPPDPLAMAGLPEVVPME